LKNAWALVFKIISHFLFFSAACTIAFIFWQQQREIENLRKGAMFLYESLFFEAGTAEPIWDSESKKFISKGEVLPNEPTSDRCNEREPEE
jgi:hypothetical protein